MKLPEYAPATSDRISTREELFEVLEMLGGFEEPQDSELESSCELLTCLDTGATRLDTGATMKAGDTLEECSSAERLLMEIDPFTTLRGVKAQRIN